MDDEWWAPGDDRELERQRREADLARLEATMGAIGYSDGVTAGEEGALQPAFDRAYVQGIDSVLGEDVEHRSMVAVMMDFYARHGAAVNMPVALSAHVFGAEDALPAEEVAVRLHAVVCDDGDTGVTAGTEDITAWLRLLGWERTESMSPAQLDVALSGMVSDKTGAPTPRS